MSFEINKLTCAILSAILLYLLSLFVGELLYHKSDVSKVKLSYAIVENTNEANESIVEKQEIINLPDEDKIKDMLQNARLDEGEKFVKKNCSSCHDFNMPIKNKIGPSLATILNRKIGSLSNYKYSKALSKMDDKWNLLNLYLFLEKPKVWAIGTKMSYRGISKKENLLNTIKYLENISNKNEN